MALYSVDAGATGVMWAACTSMGPAVASVLVAVVVPLIVTIVVRSFLFGVCLVAITH